MDFAWLSGEPLEAAQAAELMAWSESKPLGSRRDALYIRDAAVRLALQAGIGQDEIAEALRIAPRDVGRMATLKAVPAPY